MIKNLTICMLLGLIIIINGAISAQPASGQQPAISSQVMALVGGRVIDWQQLNRSYYLEPKWEKGQTRAEAYQNQLDYMITQKLFAIAVEAENQQLEKSYADQLAAIHEREMIKALYQAEVAARVNINSETYETAYTWLKKKIKLDYIYTPSIDRAKVYLQELKQSTLDQILIQVPAEDLKGTTPLFGFGDMAPEIESAAFGLEIGQTAGPITVDGKFMVIKLVDGQVDKFMSELDFAEQKKRIHQTIFEREARKISDQYLRQILIDKNIQINPDAFQILAREFSATIKNKNNEEPFPIYLSDSELHTAQLNLNEFLNRPLVTFADGEMNMALFLQKLAALPVGMRPQVNMAPQLKKAIAVIVRDHYLLQEAYKRGLDQDSSVRYETRWQQDQLLAQIERIQLARSISVTASDIHEFRQKENFAAVNASLNHALTDEKIRDIIFEVKFAEAQIHLADSLRTVFTVSVDSLKFNHHIKNPQEIVNDRPMGFAYREQYF